MTGAGSLAVHAEEFRPGGEVLHGDSPDVAVRNAEVNAEVFARLMAELAGVTVAPPLPNPPWVRWDHADPGVWPAIGCLDNRRCAPGPSSRTPPPGSCLAPACESGERLSRRNVRALAGLKAYVANLAGSPSAFMTEAG